MSESERVTPAITSVSFDTPRRMNAATVLAMQHEERMAQLTKPSRGIAPAYSLKRSTSSGSLGVVAIDVEVPVCELYPTGEDAIAHLIETFDTLAARYPMPDGYVRAK